MGVAIADLLIRRCALVLLVVLGSGTAACGSGVLPGPAVSTASASPSASASSSKPTPTRTTAGELALALPVSDLPTIAIDQLPSQALDTLRLISSRGPFPFRQDGATFGNREGLLPAHDYGWYQEYTVITPGSPDRGARRIIAGQSDERYYTDDHYVSFREVVQGVMP